jgi:hypothetical protein
LSQVECDVLYCNHDKDIIISDDIWSIAKGLKKKLDKHGFGKSRYDIEKRFVFTECRLKMITMYVGDVVVLTMFNCLEYEPIITLSRGNNPEDEYVHPLISERLLVYRSICISKQSLIDTQLTNPNTELVTKARIYGVYMPEMTFKVKLGGSLWRNKLNPKLFEAIHSLDEKLKKDELTFKWPESCSKPAPDIKCIADVVQS